MNQQVAWQNIINNYIARQGFDKSGDKYLLLWIMFVWDFTFLQHFIKYELVSKNLYGVL